MADAYPFEDARLATSPLASEPSGALSAFLLPLKQFRRSVIDEQLAIADISRQHGVGRMAGLLSYLPRRDPHRWGRGGQSRP